MGRNIAVIVGVVIFVVVVVVLKHQWAASNRPSTSDAVSQERAAEEPSTAPSQEKMPRFVQLGAGCKACRQMEPIIEKLREEFAGRIRIESVNVMKTPDYAATFRWTLLPCQVFLDAEGNELWRHEGPLTEEEIRAQFRERGMM